MRSKPFLLLSTTFWMLFMASKKSYQCSFSIAHLRVHIFSSMLVVTELARYLSFYYAFSSFLYISVLIYIILLLVILPTTIDACKIFPRGLFWWVSNLLNFIFSFVCFKFGMRNVKVKPEFEEELAEKANFGKDSCSATSSSDIILP